MIKIQHLTSSLPDNPSLSLSKFQKSNINKTKIPPNPNINPSNKT